MTSVGIMASGVQTGPGLKASLGSNGNVTAAGTTLVITTTAAIAVDDLVVVRVAGDNLNATTPTITCADSGGNTYTSHAFRGNNATAAAGIVGGILATKATAAIAIGGTITATFSGGITAKAMYAESFTGFNNTLRNAAVVASGVSTGPAVTSGTANAGDLVIGAVAAETRAAVTYDSDTTNGSWSTGVQALAAATGTDNTRVEINGQYKIVNASGAQTYNNTITSTDWAALIAIFQAA